MNSSTGPSSSATHRCAEFQNVVSQSSSGQLETFITYLDAEKKALVVCIGHILGSSLLEIIGFELEGICLNFLDRFEDRRVDERVSNRSSLHHAT